MSKFRFIKGLGLAALLGLTAGTIASVVSAQIPTRMHATKLADIATGTPTAVTCTQSGTGCFLDVQVAGGTLPNAQTVAAGTGAATATLSGVLTTSTTSVCTTVGTGEETLWTYTLPANTLSSDGRGVKIRTSVETAANANNKSYKLYFGTLTALSRGPSADNATTVFMDTTVFRTGASTQIVPWRVLFLTGTVTSTSNAITLAESTAGPIVIKVTGQNAVASASDICFKAATVETTGSP